MCVRLHACHLSSLEAEAGVCVWGLSQASEKQKNKKMGDEEEKAGWCHRPTHAARHQSRLGFFPHPQYQVWGGGCIGLYHEGRKGHRSSPATPTPPWLRKLTHNTQEQEDVEPHGGLRPRSARKGGVSELTPSVLPPLSPLLPPIPQATPSLPSSDPSSPVCQSLCLLCCLPVHLPACPSICRSALLVSTCRA